MDPFIIMLPDNFSLVRLRKREGANRQIDIGLNIVSLHHLLTITRGVDMDRPIIHKLMVNTISVLGSVIEKVVVDDFIDKIFHSHIYVKVGEEVRPIDAHVTDAIGLSVVQDCPLFVLEDVFKRSAERKANRQTEISDEQALRMLENFDPDKTPKC